MLRGVGFGLNPGVLGVMGFECGAQRWPQLVRRRPRHFPGRALPRHGGKRRRAEE